MEQKELILSALAQMAKGSTQPSLYQFIPRELILRLPIDWSSIYFCLSLLEEEGAVRIFHADTIRFSITQKRIDTAKKFQGQDISHS